MTFYTRKSETYTHSPLPYIEGLDDLQLHLHTNNKNLQLFLLHSQIQYAKNLSSAKWHSPQKYLQTGISPFLVNRIQETFCFCMDKKYSKQAATSYCSGVDEVTMSAFGVEVERLRETIISALSCITTIHIKVWGKMSLEKTRFNHKSIYI